MKIGLRTIKTAVAAPIAVLLAGGLSLESAASAAIITILTVTNTKRSTAKTALNRLFSLTLATSIAAICFHSWDFIQLSSVCIYYSSSPCRFSLI